MAGIHGVGTRDLGNGRDLSGIVTNFETSLAIDAVETTTHQPGVANPSKSYIPGNEGATFTADLIWSDVDDAFIRGLLTDGANSIWTRCQGQDVLGQPCDLLAAVDTEYTPSSDVNDAVKASVAGVSVVGLETGIIQHVLKGETGSGSETPVNNLAGTANGGAGYIHVTAGTAFGTLDVIIEQSATGAFAGEETTLMAFTQVVGAEVAERVEVALGTTVQQYLRATWTFGGGLTAATFHVAFHRRP